MKLCINIVKQLQATYPKDEKLQQLASDWKELKDENKLLEKDAKHTLKSENELFTNLITAHKQLAASAAENERLRLASTEGCLSCTELGAEIRSIKSQLIKADPVYAAVNAGYTLSR